MMLLRKVDTIISADRICFWQTSRLGSSEGDGKGGRNRFAVGCHGKGGGSLADSGYGGEGDGGGWRPSAECPTPARAAPSGPAVGTVLQTSSHHPTTHFCISEVSEPKGACGGNKYCDGSGGNVVDKDTRSGARRPVPSFQDTGDYVHGRGVVDVDGGNDNGWYGCRGTWHSSKLLD